MFRSLRNGFISGLVLVAPLGVTLFVLSVLVDRVGKTAANIFFGRVFDEQFQSGFWSFVLGCASIVIVALLITLVGWLSKLFFARFLLNIGEQFVVRLPFINTIYKSVKQIVKTFAQQQKAIFQETVLVEYPRKGMWAVGFMTGNTQGEVQEKTSKQMLNVFVPTTPNPTSGFLLMVPKEDVIKLDMAVGDGMKLIISGGAVVPPSPSKAISEQAPEPSAS